MDFRLGPNPGVLIPSCHGFVSSGAPSGLRWGWARRGRRNPGGCVRRGSVTNADKESGDVVGALCWVLLSSSELKCNGPVGEEEVDNDIECENRCQRQGDAAADGHFLIEPTPQPTSASLMLTTSRQSASPGRDDDDPQSVLRQELERHAKALALTDGLFDFVGPQRRALRQLVASKSRLGCGPHLKPHCCPRFTHRCCSRFRIYTRRRRRQCFSVRSSDLFRLPSFTEAQE